MNGLELLDALPVAVYMTDAKGNITYFNDAAAELWGRRPEPGERWCGSWRLFWPDGRPMRHDECPMAVTLRTGEPVRGVEAVAERPDGTRILFVPYPSVVRDESGEISGAINLLMDVSDRMKSELASARLAAIVQSTDDAIVSKTLEGKVTSWNASATRIFGYAAEEMIG
jgi:PAS domain S-box-containing protein